MTTPTLTPANAVAVVAAKARTYGGKTPVAVSNDEKGIVMGVYAPGGTGKTTVMSSAVRSKWGGPMVVLNARGNLHVVASYGSQIEVIDIDKFDEVEKIRLDFIKELNAGVFPYKSILLDTATEMWAMDLRDRYGPMTHVQWEKHSATTSDMLNIARNWHDLATLGNKPNVFFTFQKATEKRRVGSQEVLRSEIAVSKALQEQLPGIINFLGHLYIGEETKPWRRVLDFRPVESVHQAKFQVDPMDEFAKLIPMEIWQPDLGAILDTLRGHMPFPVEKHTKAGAK